ncbi:MAG: response regulator [Spirochaetales bacterium]|nr:response regulator [Spirochaetales bacterium]
MKTIFAVDDSPTARASIEYTLSKGGFKVELAEDGVIALDKINKYSEPIDVFLFDVNMPNMDGITLIKEVRKLPNFKFTPILFLTTESQESKKMEGKNAGASGWIVKPFEPDQLVSLMKRFTGE